MTWLDQAIGWISPAAGLRRVRARTAMDVLHGVRSYEGAKLGRRTDGWIAPLTDADSALGPAADRLRARSRDLVRDNPWASKAVRTLAANVIGSGIVPRADDRTDTVWARWGEVADAAGRTDIYGLQAQIFRCVVESGEVLVRQRIRPRRDRMAIPLQLQVLEPDHLDGSRDLTGAATRGGYIYRGIEFDAIGRRVGYWIFPSHPGSGAQIPRVESRFVPAEEVLHIYEPLRPGQSRGVPWFAPAIVKLNDLDGYDAAELMRKKIESCFVAMVTGREEATPLGADTTDEKGDRIERFEPGMIEYLKAGEDVKFGEPKSVSGYAEYMRVQLHAIAAAVGLTYEQLTGDLSQVNFSSARMGWLEFRRRVSAVQTQLLLPQLLLPVWTWFTDVAQASGELRGTARVPVKWTWPKFEAIQPFEDAKAEHMRLRDGTMTWPEAVAGHGYDPADQLAEIAATNAKLDAAGIVLDIDPRQITSAGQLQMGQGASDDEPEGPPGRMIERRPWTNGHAAP